MNITKDKSLKRITGNDAKASLGNFNELIVIDPEQYPDIENTSKMGVKILDTYRNLEYLLRRFNADIKYNLMSRRAECTFPDFNISPEDTENYALSLIDYLATLNKMPTKKLSQHLDFIALNNTYHPIVDCIKAKPWDKTPRLDIFIATLHSPTPELTYKIVKTWMVCAIAAAHSVSGFVNHGVLVLQGSQRIGKTTWVKNLDPINCCAVKEGVFLDPTNKDSIAQIASYWIVELGELDSIFGKAAIGRLKSYITMEYDFLRVPYARKPMRLNRRTAYVATVNEGQYLVDDTGNRRWWTIPVTAITNTHGLDMQQVWAEVYELWQDGALTYLPYYLEAEVDESNKQFERIDPLYEKVMTFYDWEHEARKELTATAILEEMGYKKPTLAETRNVSKILIEINGKNHRKSNGLKLHSVPYRIIPQHSYT